MNNELIEKIKAAKTNEDVMAIINEMPRMELSEEQMGNVAGGTGRVELTEAQAERVVGGGHYVTCPPCDQIWIALMDTGYVYGSGDRFQDAAYTLECFASAGYPVDLLVDITYELFPEFGGKGASADIRQSLLTSGPVYLVDCIKGKLENNYGGSFSW